MSKTSVTKKVYLERHDVTIEDVNGKTDSKTIKNMTNKQIEKMLMDDSNSDDPSKIFNISDTSTALDGMLYVLAIKRKIYDYHFSVRAGGCFIVLGM